MRKWDRQYGISGIYKTPVEVRSNGVWCIFGAFFWAQKSPTRLIINILQDFQSGKGGIRTPGASQHGGFQDRCNRPLYHLSSALCRCSFSKAMQRYGYFLKHASVCLFFFQKKCKKVVFPSFLNFFIAHFSYQTLLDWENPPHSPST